MRRDAGEGATKDRSRRPVKAGLDSKNTDQKKYRSEVVLGHAGWDCARVEHFLLPFEG